ncbi:calfacilitin-like [Microcaecilia unicolor]|uniref:Calfacilitin-like n=1 Tax=Microcaecilia unicolor TaxID=1415580 RepID=A0A6P7WL87_9AMPH|nr:calfacilitin-like [Microcaecilia unicolor]
MALQQYPAFLVLCSFLAFRALSRILSRLPLPQHVARDAMRTWRWRNLSVSMVHSLLTGSWALVCVFQTSEILTDIADGYSGSAHLLICLTSGYFILDTADIILSGQSKASWEFLLHHILVAPPFMYAAITRHYLAGGVISLFVEVNSVFLHTRLLLKLSNAQDSVFYRVNKYINLLTFICFRLGAQLYLTNYMIRKIIKQQQAKTFQVTYSSLVDSVILVSLCSVDIMILIYLYRLVRADFLPWSKDRLKRNTSSHHNSKKFLSD